MVSSELEELRSFVTVLLLYQTVKLQVLCHSRRPCKFVLYMSGLKGHKMNIKENC